VQPVMALHRGATFSGYDSKLRSGTTSDDVNAVNRQSSDDSRRTLHCASAAGNCSVIQFSPDKQHCSTPAGHGRHVCATTSRFVTHGEPTADTSFCSKSRCSTKVSRHASIDHNSMVCFDDRPSRKAEKLSGSFLSGGGLGFLQKLSRGSARPASPGNADVSTASTRRRSSFRDSFKKIFLSRRFG